MFTCKVPQDIFPNAELWYLTIQMTAMVLPTGQVKAEVSMLKHWQLPADGHKWELKWPLVGDFQAIVVVMKMKDVNIYYRQDFLGEYHTHAQA